MSAQTLAPVADAGGGPADATAATQRVQQLQTLIAQARQGGSTASFAAALDAASAGSGAGQGATATASAGIPAASTPAPPAAYAPTGYAPATSVSAMPLTVSSTPPTVSATPPTGSTTPPTGGSTATPYDGAIAQAAARYNLDPAVLHGLIQQESGFNPNSRSSAGALGLTQLMPGTASSLGVANPLDPVESIEGGARYLSQMMSRFGGNTEEALAAYNAGPGAVSQYGGVPPYAETQDYVSKVLGYADAYRQKLTSTGTPTPTGSIV